MGDLEPALLVWADLELTGLDVDRASVLEVALIPTDRELTPLADPFVRVVHLPDSGLDEISPEVLEMHSRSGLLAVARDESVLSAGDVENHALEYLERALGQSPAVHAGYFLDLDRTVLRRDMPRLLHRFGFRTLDIRTLEESAEAWSPAGRISRSSERKHRALADAEEALGLAYGYKRLFQAGPVG